MSTEAPNAFLKIQLANSDHNFAHLLLFIYYLFIILFIYN